MAGLARLLYSEKLLKGSLTTRNEKKHTENATVRRSKDLKKTKPLKEEATDSRPDYLLQVEETLITTTRGCAHQQLASTSSLSQISHSRARSCPPFTQYSLIRH